MFLMVMTTITTTITKIKYHINIKATMTLKEQSKDCIETLLDYIKNSGYFPDCELADSIEQASKELRQNLKLREFEW
jgi:hypothetical protein